MENKSSTYKITMSRLDKAYLDEQKSQFLARANDPKRLYLTVKEDYWDKRAGRAIGASDTLLRIAVSIYPEEDNTWLGELLPHLLRNRSIESLAIEFCQRVCKQNRRSHKWDLFHSLLPFIENNSNLIDIKLEGGTAFMLRSLSSALSSCKNKRLQRIDLGDNQDEAGYGEIFTSLNDYNDLKHICVRGSKIGTAGVTVLSNLLKNPTSSIVSLKLENNSLDDEHIVILRNGVIGNKNVTSIGFPRNRSITAVG